MSTADQYRAFARECIRWANGATNIEHREAFLDMATRQPRDWTISTRYSTSSTTYRTQKGRSEQNAQNRPRMGVIERSHRSLIGTKSQEASLYREFARRAIPATGR